MVHATPPLWGCASPQVCQARTAPSSDESLLSYLWSGWEPQPNPGLSACEPAPAPEACPALSEHKVWEIKGWSIIKGLVNEFKPLPSALSSQPSLKPSVHSYETRG